LRIIAGALAATVTDGNATLSGIDVALAAVSARS
jgi:hypothetical protein